MLCEVLRNEKYTIELRSRTSTHRSKFYREINVNSRDKIKSIKARCGGLCQQCLYWEGMVAHFYSANTGKAKELKSLLGYIVSYRTDLAVEEDFVPDGKNKEKRLEARREERKIMENIMNIEQSMKLKVINIIQY